MLRYVTLDQILILFNVLLNYTYYIFCEFALN